jgi:hypothetical protein
LESEVQMRPVASQKSNTPIMGRMNTNVREGLSPSIAWGAIYLTDFWEENIRHEFEAHSVEDTQEVHWQGTRLILGRSGYYVPDSTRASWSTGRQYNQGKEGVATAYEWFLSLPPVVPYSVIWIGGVALLGTCALVLYWVGRVLVGLMAGPT